MPLPIAKLQSLVESGKAFIVGRFLGCEVGEMLCRVKGDASKKELRIIRRHTVHNRNAVHVYTEFLNVGARVEKDKDGRITKVWDDKNIELTSNLKEGQEVLVVLQKYERDGAGHNIQGEVSAL